MEDLTEAYLNLVTRMRPLVGSPGLSAAVYTQTTDVEIEVNGLLTYDREVNKLSPDVLAAAHRRVYGPPPKIETVIATSQKEPQEWRVPPATPTRRCFRPPPDNPPRQPHPTPPSPPPTPPPLPPTHTR